MDGYVDVCVEYTLSSSSALYIYSLLTVEE